MTGVSCEFVNRYLLLMSTQNSMRVYRFIIVKWQFCSPFELCLISMTLKHENPAAIEKTNIFSSFEIPMLLKLNQCENVQRLLNLLWKLRRNSNKTHKLLSEMFQHSIRILTPATSFHSYSPKIQRIFNQKS